MNWYCAQRKQEKVLDYKMLFILHLNRNVFRNSLGIITKFANPVKVRYENKIENESYGK